MVQLAEKTQKSKVLSIKMKIATKHVDDIDNERNIVKSCLSGINQYPLRLVETPNSLFTVSVRQQLSDKLQLVFVMPNQIECVSGSEDFPKQGGETDQQSNPKPKTETDQQLNPNTKTYQKGNEASALKKGKGKVIDDEEEEELSNSENLVRKKRDIELHDLYAIRKKLEAEEVKVKNAKIVVETLKALFPRWSMKRIQKEAIDEPSIYWLEPSISFDLVNDVENQFDFPITPRAFLFECFENIEKSLIFVVVKPGFPVQTEDFVNIKFKGFIGSNHVLDEFSLLGLPFMNTYHWISLFHIITKEEKKYEPTIAHLKRMLICYIHEITKMDVEIESVLKKRPILNPEEQTKDVQKLKIEIIRK
ncbi:unnamed protein product [Lactuca saligna]|uniref:Uncharacterized protein n=1 Tax=Lactuca saligna TaxID=75948 RepID=A0AA35YLJ9_LACSI|nr:unnamed protein product [Lactuca saligna]